jgi:hypothetical protein
VSGRPLGSLRTSGAEGRSGARAAARSADALPAQYGIGAIRVSNVKPVDGSNATALPVSPP